MDTITTAWPASYRGVGLTLEKLPDGTYQGIAQGGYRSVPYADMQDAFADVTAWITTQEGK